MACKKVFSFPPPPPRPPGRLTGASAAGGARPEWLISLHVILSTPYWPLRGTKTSLQPPGQGKGSQGCTRSREGGQTDRPRGRQGSSCRTCRPSRHEQATGRSTELRLGLPRHHFLDSAQCVGQSVRRLRVTNGPNGRTERTTANSSASGPCRPPSGPGRRLRPWCLGRPRLSSRAPRKRERHRSCRRTTTLGTPRTCWRPSS